MKTAIINLDLINEICHPDGKLANYADRIKAKGLITAVNQLTTWGRSHDYLIAHVKVAFRDDYQDGSSRSPVFSQAKKHQALKLSTWGCQFCDELQLEPSDNVIIKHRVSAFYGTDLDLILRANCIDHLILCGVATNNAVELTAREAHDRDYIVTIAADATECASDSQQQDSLQFLERISNIVIVKDLLCADIN